MDPDTLNFPLPYDRHHISRNISSFSAWTRQVETGKERPRDTSPNTSFRSRVVDLLPPPPPPRQVEPFPFVSVKLINLKSLTVSLQIVLLGRTFRTYWGHWVFSWCTSLVHSERPCLVDREIFRVLLVPLSVLTLRRCMYPLSSLITFLTDTGSYQKRKKGK